MEGPGEPRRGLRWMWCVLAAAAVVAMPFAVAATVARRQPAEEGFATVTEENFLRIELGMERAAAEAVLGGPRPTRRGPTG
jgi:hypothetical protein